MASTPGSASSASYDPWAIGMPSMSATARACSPSRDAIATTSLRAALRIPGITFRTAMSAVDRIPQRTVPDISASS
jgi:hypothetical protein